MEREPYSWKWKAAVFKTALDTLSSTSIFMGTKVSLDIFLELLGPTNLTENMSVAQS